MARISAAHSISSSRVVGKKMPLRLRAHPVAGASDALQRDGDRTRRSDLDGQIDRADIDAEFERGGRHHGSQLAVLQARFGFLAQRARQAAVMRQNGILAQPLGRARAPRAPTGGAC